jgi:hypothetical protein
MYFWSFCEFNCVFLSFFNVIARYSKIFTTFGVVCKYYDAVGDTCTNAILQQKCLPCKSHYFFVVRVEKLIMACKGSMAQMIYVKPRFCLFMFLALKFVLSVFFLLVEWCFDDSNLHLKDF